MAERAEKYCSCYFYDVGGDDLFGTVDLIYDFYCTGGGGYLWGFGDEN